MYSSSEDLQTFCIDKGLIGCNYSIFAHKRHDGGGSMFVEQMLSQQYIKDKLKVDSGNIMEMCSGPGFMGFYLHREFNLKKAFFVDYNPEVKRGVEKTLIHNNVEGAFFESFALDSYSGDNVDLIILNPPHVTKEEDYLKIKESVINWNIEDIQKRRILLDQDFEFHKSFCSSVSSILNSGGKIGFIENPNFIPSQLIIDELGNKFTFETLTFTKKEIKDFYLLIATKK